MKKLIFLLILVIGITRDAQAISTELFGLPTAYTLKKGERLVGFYYLFASIFINVGITERLQGDLEFEGLLWAPFINFKYQILESKLACISIGGGEKLNAWNILTRLSEGEISMPDYFPFYYIAISKNLQKNALHSGLIKGWNPWMCRATALAEDLFWVGCEKKLTNKCYIRGILIYSLGKPQDKFKYGVIIGPGWEYKKFFTNINAHFIKRKIEPNNAFLLSFTVGYKKK